ncbi:MAG: hypothetical protein K1X67_08145 [Fimbriimonadaceae bacterium]|nr:hypothetical protein [Fimbriimonadaceae bacterium]
MRLLGAPWAGGKPANPGYASLGVFQRVLDICPALEITHLRFNLGLEVKAMPDLGFLRKLVALCASRGVGVFGVIGDIRTPTAYAQQVADVIASTLEEHGLDPAESGVIQVGCEHGFYGVGDLLRNAPRDQEGIWPKDAIANIVRLASGLKLRGMLLAAPSIEAERPETMARELKSLAGLGPVGMKFDMVCMQCYKGRTQAWADALRWRQLALRGSAVGAWSTRIVITEMNQEGGGLSIEQAKAAMDEVRGLGFDEVGWFSGWDKYAPHFSLLPVSA